MQGIQELIHRLLKGAGFSRAGWKTEVVTAVDKAGKSNRGPRVWGLAEHLRKRLFDAFPRAHCRALHFSARVCLWGDEIAKSWLLVVPQIRCSFAFRTRGGGRRENVGGRGRQILKEQA